jgi:hypothetical protein
MRTAGNSGLKRTESSIQLMRDAKLGIPPFRSDETKAKMSANRANSKAVRVTNSQTGEIRDYLSIRRASANLGVKARSFKYTYKEPRFLQRQRLHS